MEISVERSCNMNAYRLYSCALLCPLAVFAWDCENEQAQWNRSDDFPADRAELLKFATGMRCSEWYDGTTNWMDDAVSVCDWDGICCAPIPGKGNRVTEIHVERNGLRGAFAASFAPTLTELRVLNVHLNNVTNFPPRVAVLTHLREAKFGRNPIHGTVPVGFASLHNLTKFNCNFCALSGQFPDVFGALPHLEESFWDGNNFTGTLPTSLGSLSSLTKLSFNLNSLTGSVPAGLCGLALMQDCRIGSDTDYGPYGLGSERQWVIKARGNLFACPVAACVANGVCNASTADPVVSPIRCH
eukprot:g3903.t1